jgi:hypothetical protein
MYAVRGCTLITGDLDLHHHLSQAASTINLTNCVATMPERGPEQWLEEIIKCRYLPENDMKQLCEMVKDLLMEGMLDH